MQSSQILLLLLLLLSTTTTISSSSSVSASLPSSPSSAYPSPPPSVLGLLTNIYLIVFIGLFIYCLFTCIASSSAFSSSLLVPYGRLCYGLAIYFECFLCDISYAVRCIFHCETYRGSHTSSRQLYDFLLVKFNFEKLKIKFASVYSVYTYLTQLSHIYRVLFINYLFIMYLFVN